MKDFVELLAEKITPNPNSYDNYKRIYIPEGVVPPSEGGEPIRVNVLFKHIQVLAPTSFSSSLVCMIIRMTIYYTVI